MPQFLYKAVDLDGRRVAGSLNASSQEQLVSLLRRKDLFLIDAAEKDYTNKSRYKLKSAEVVEFSRRIGVMLGAGIPLIRILRMLAENTNKPALKTIYQNITMLIQTGTSLSDAMQMQGGAFPQILISMFRIGEMTGSLPKNAQRMAEHFEKEHRMKKKISSAAAYPLFLLVFAIAITLIIFVVILPEFFTLFEGMDLPGITKAVIAFSNLLTQHTTEVIVVVVAVVVAVAFIRVLPQVKMAYQKWFLRIPKIGSLLKTIYTSRFARTLSSLYASGMAITDAVENIGDVIGNVYIKSQLSNVVSEVKNGEMLSNAIMNVDGFSRELYVTLTVGEESGQLDKVLSDISDTFDYDADQAISRLVGFLGPLMIILIAVIVGMVMLSVFLPITQLYQSYGSMM